MVNAVLGLREQLLDVGVVHFSVVGTLVLAVFLRGQLPSSACELLNRKQIETSTRPKSSKNSLRSLDWVAALCKLNNSPELFRCPVRPPLPPPVGGPRFWINPGEVIQSRVSSVTSQQVYCKERKI